MADTLNRIHLVRDIHRGRRIISQGETGGLILRRASQCVLERHPVSGDQKFVGIQRQDPVRRVFVERHSREMVASTLL